MRASRFALVTLLLCLLPLAELATPSPASARSGDELATLNRRVEQLHRAGKYSEAIPIAERALALVERLHGPYDASVSAALSRLAGLYAAQGRYAKAEPLHKRALAVREKALGAEHPNTAQSLNMLALLYYWQGRYSEAEPLWKRALEIREKTLGSEHPDTAQGLNNLAEVYRAQGRLSDAERLHKRALDIRERALGSEHADNAWSLHNLAEVYREQGRYDEAEPLWKRALEIRERALGPEHPDTAQTLNNLALLYYGQGRYSEAEPLWKRALEIREKMLGSEHPNTAQALNNLAEVYRMQGRYGEAEPLHKRALDIRERTLRPEHPDKAWSLHNLAALYDAQGQYAKAETLHKRALTIREKALGPEHPDTAQSHNNLAGHYYGQRAWDAALNHARRASDIIVERAKRAAGASESATTASMRTESARNTPPFGWLIRAAWQLGQEHAELRPPPSEDAFAAAQRMGQTAAGTALAQMAVRFAKGESELSRLVRDQQNFSGEWQRLGKQLVAARSLPPAGRSSGGELALANRFAEFDRQLVVMNARLKVEFPDYYALASPEPLSIPAAQALLNSDEALLQFTFVGSDGFVWTLTRDAVRWVRIELDTKALVESVASLRCGLDHNDAERAERCRVAWKTSPSEEQLGGQKVQVLPFDVARAYVLYKALLGPAEDMIKGRHLLVVPSGPLTNLPFHVLVTEPPKIAIPAKLADYRSVAWLGVRQPITVLPSVASLKALREFARTSKATKPYLGIGNPLLEGQQDDPQYGKYYKEQALAARDRQFCLKTSTERVVLAAARSPAGFARLSRSSEANIEQIREIAPLPETADELCEVGRQLGVSEGDILLGARATETALKDLSESGRLADYAILHFATHGALTGQVQGSAEPGLILSPPEKGTIDPKLLERDDGFLTASEIATLKLDANWVILSACNTAGGSGESAEALSGLARAFFYAGARALLVSHWEVGSDAAVKLTTRAFVELKAKPKIGRAEAFRVSMRELIEKGSLAEAHPSQWAPFVVVGEGAR